VKILYLHGWNSVVGGVKPTHLQSHGHDVHEPALDHEDFQAALRTAQMAFDEHRPDIVVGSSRGGAVAMNIDSNIARLVLICPAWRKWGLAKTVKPGTQILHSRTDDVVPFENSVELLANSGLPECALIEVGQDHRLADPEPLEALVRAVEARFEPS
jgi:alpha-beta hydrolase superfamily lysophospholipase